MILVRLLVYLGSMNLTFITQIEMDKIIASANAWFENTITNKSDENFKNDLRYKFVNFTNTWYIQLIVIAFAPLIVKLYSNAVQPKEIDIEDE